MKINFLLTTIITVATGTAISSCSTSYKTGQTPDDVYYSPVRLQTDNVRREEKIREDNTVTVYDNSTPVYTPEDRELRRRVHNRRYRRYHDRYDYPYGNNGYSVYQNPKSGTTTSGTPTNTRQPRKTNLGAYAPNTSAPDSTKSYNPKSGMQSTSSNTPVRTFSSPENTRNNGSGVGNFIRKVFTQDNSNNGYTPNNNSNSGSYNNTSSSPSRTFERSSNNDTRSSNTSSSSSSSTNSSSGSSTSAPVRTFKKD